MRRIAFLAALIAAVPVSAGAGVWKWGCIGTAGDQQIVFNRYSLVVAPEKPARGKLDVIVHKDDLTAGPQDLDNRWDMIDVNSGFLPEMKFEREAEKRTLVLTEKSSKKISSRSRLVCNRDESIDTFRKVYTMQRDNEPAREITMQCMEYQLSTTGGRRGCQ